MIVDLASKQAQCLFKSMQVINSLKYWSLQLEALISTKYIVWSLDVIETPPVMQNMIIL